MPATTNRRHLMRRAASIARTVTSTRFSCMGDLPLGEESVIYIDRFDPYWSARVNKFGDTCSGTGDTRDEALAAARKRCDEHLQWKGERGLA